MAALPVTASRISVLDRTKESGSAAEPLYLDVLSSLTEHDAAMGATKHRVVVGGIYGLGSKEFTPAMAVAVFDNLSLPSPKKRFTVRDRIGGRQDQGREAGKGEGRVQKSSLTPT